MSQSRHLLSHKLSLYIDDMLLDENTIWIDRGRRGRPWVAGRQTDRQTDKQTRKNDITVNRVRAVKVERTGLQSKNNISML